jgi:hypothetical protein
MDAQNQPIPNTVDDHYHISIPYMDHAISVPKDLGLDAAKRVARATAARAKESAITLGAGNEAPKAQRPRAVVTRLGGKAVRSDVATHIFNPKTGKIEHT